MFEMFLSIAAPALLGFILLLGMIAFSRTRVLREQLESHKRLIYTLCSSISAVKSMAISNSSGNAVLEKELSELAEACGKVKAWWEIKGYHYKDKPNDKPEREGDDCFIEPFTFAISLPPVLEEAAAKWEAAAKNAARRKPTTGKKATKKKGEPFFKWVR